MIPTLRSPPRPSSRPYLPQSRPKLRDEASAEPEQEAEQELYEGSGINEDTGDKYAADADYTVIEPEPPKKEKTRREPKSFRESVAVPVISALAFIAMKIKQSQVTLGETSYESEDLGEEMQPGQGRKVLRQAHCRAEAQNADSICALRFDGLHILRASGSGRACRCGRKKRRVPYHDDIRNVLRT